LCPAKPTARTFESYEQAGGWLRATFGAWADELSDDEHDAIRSYASPAYKTLNLALREHRALDRDQERQVAALDRALRVPLPEPVIAYRGVELEKPFDFTARAGQPLVFRAYVSTSLVRPIAEGFCALATTKHHAVLFETGLAAGTLCRLPRPGSAHARSGAAAPPPPAVAARGSAPAGARTPILDGQAAGHQPVSA
jgi:hypothetical protein